MKILLFTVVLASSLFAFLLPYSSEIQDGINSAFADYNSFIKEQNNNLKSRYEDEKKSTIEDILKEHKEKELHLTHIEKMAIEGTLDKGDINSEFIKFKLLKNKQGEE